MKKGHKCKISSFEKCGSNNVFSELNSGSTADHLAIKIVQKE